MSCNVCPDVKGHGWKLAGVTHCPECHATWRLGTKVTHCVTCHETFTTDSNCQRHQNGTKNDPGFRCRPPASVGLVTTERNFGRYTLTVWQMPGDDRPRVAQP